MRFETCPRESFREELNVSEFENSFSLEIPLAVIRNLCLTQRKYLLYLGWCILGFDVGVEDLGLAIEDEDGNRDEIDSDGDVEGGVIYYLVIAGEPDMAVVDLEVIRTAVPSETTGTRSKFRQDLLRRDKCCVFTGLDAELGQGITSHPI